MVDKKRKRDSHAPTQTAVDVEIKAPSSNSLTPIVATTPGIQLPQKLGLNVYTRPRQGKKAKTTLPDEYLVHGSTEKIDYEGREMGEDTEMERYYVGVYDPATGEVEFHPAPRVHIRREIKEYKEKDAELATKNSGGAALFSASKALLGTAFGTKKSKKAIERRELNQVDVKEHDTGLTTSLVDQIGENTESMPTREDLEREHDDQRPLPPHKTEGCESAADVYNLDDLITPEELESLWVEDWYKEGKSSKFSVPNNSHVTNRIIKLGLAKSRNAHNTKKLKILRYISILRNFYTFLNNRKESQRLLEDGKEKEIAEKLQISRDLCVSLLKRYTEVVGGPTRQNDDKDNFRPRRKSTPPYLTKLLNYMAILCLMAEENFQVDVYYLKDDLGITTSNLLQIFVNVGCKKKELSSIQAESLGIPKGEAKLHRVAYLTATPEFPKARTRKRTAAKR